MDKIEKNQIGIFNIDEFYPGWLVYNDSIMDKAEVMWIDDNLCVHRELLTLEEQAARITMLDPLKPFKKPWIPSITTSEVTEELRQRWAYSDWSYEAGKPDITEK